MELAQEVSVFADTFNQSLGGTRELFGDHLEGVYPFDGLLCLIFCLVKKKKHFFINRRWRWNAGKNNDISILFFVYLEPTNCY